MPTPASMKNKPSSGGGTDDLKAVLGGEKGTLKVKKIVGILLVKQVY